VAVVEAVVAVVAVAVSAVAVVFEARELGLVWAWAFIRITADIIPTTATQAFAMRFGSAS
jgi:hypothetical protein